VEPVSIDRLQNQIRKRKNPSMLVFSLDKNVIPPRYLEASQTIPKAFEAYAKELLSALADTVPAVRFVFGTFALYGGEGLTVLAGLTALARKLGYYVVLDGPEMLSAKDAELIADCLLSEDCRWKSDGVLVSPYIGSDGLKPLADVCKASDKDLFVALRTGNRSASELQDLLTGSRLVYTAAADMAKRLGEGNLGRCGYSKIAGMCAATSADCLRTLRSKYPQMFLVADSLDYSNTNAKICALAFDKLGHGAVVCAGSLITAAWKEETGFAVEPIASAVQAAERMKKNLSRYVSVL